jgi:hypothetical protein
MAANPTSAPDVKLEVWEQNLADLIDDYVSNYKGSTGASPMPSAFSPSLGPYFVLKGRQYGVDPSLVLGICRSESSMGTAPHVNGGIFNIYGNSAHFSHRPGNPKKLNHKLYDNYLDPTEDAFITLANYLAGGLKSTLAIYKKYEGESSYLNNVPLILSVQARLHGNPEDVTYACDAKRKDALEQAAKKL